MRTESSWEEVVDDQKMTAGSWVEDGRAVGGWG